MSLVLSVPTDPKDASKMIDLSIDPSNKNITVSGNCPNNSNSQELTLSWEDVDHDDKKNVLDRNITMVFMKNTTTSSYGISEIKGTVEVRVVNRTQSTFVDIAGTFSPPLLETAVNKSYTCPSDSPISLNVTWHGSGIPTTTTTKKTTTTTKKTTTTTKKTTTTTKKTTTTTKKTTTTTKKTTTTTKKTTTTTKKTTTTTPKTTTTTPKTTTTTPKTTTTTKKTTTTTKNTTTTTTKTSTTTTKYSNHTTTTTPKTTTTTKLKIMAQNGILENKATSTTVKPTTTIAQKNTTTTVKPTTTIAPKNTTITKKTTTTHKPTNTTTTKKTTTTHKPAPHFTASLTLSKVQIDAFRGANVTKDAFQEESLCDSGSPGNDLIPIIVGCVLAGMVVIVLVAYLIGRRYQAATPYQNLD